MSEKSEDYNNNISDKNREKSAKSKPGNESYKTEEYEFVKETIIDKKKELKNSVYKILLDLLCIIIVCVATCFIYFRFFDKNNIGRRENITSETEATTKEVETTRDSETKVPEDKEETLEKTILSYMIVLKNYKETHASPFAGQEETAEDEEENTLQYVEGETTGDKEDILEHKEENSSADEETFENSEGENSDYNEEEYTATISESSLNKYIGVVIYKDTNVIIAANSNDVDESNQIYAEVYTGTQIKEVPVRVLMTEEEMGITFLCIDSRDLNSMILSNISAAKIAQNVEFEMGADCIYSGYVKEAGITISHGNVLSEGDISRIEDIEYCKYVANVNISNAHNGYIFSTDGKLAGICSSVEANISTVVFVDISAFKSMVQNIATYGYTTYIGIVGQKVDYELEMLVGKDLPDGVFVTNVALGSPAYYAGIGVGDIIYNVDGNTITDMNDIRGIIDRYKLGDVIPVEIHRYMGNRFNTYSVNVQLGKR